MDQATLYEHVGGEKEEEKGEEKTVELEEKDRDVQDVVIQTQQPDKATTLPYLSKKLIFLFAFTCFAVIGNLYYAQPLLVLMGYAFHLLFSSPYPSITSELLPPSPSPFSLPLLAPSTLYLHSKTTIGTIFTKVILKWDLSLLPHRYITPPMVVFVCIDFSFFFFLFLFLFFFSFFLFFFFFF
jgi:hypothetical protein